MATIVTRTVKGSKLTIQEMDDNFININQQGIDNTTAIGGKQETLVPSGQNQNLKTVGGQILLGTGNIPFPSGEGKTTDAGDLVSGTLADARLSGNIPIKVNGLIPDEDLKARYFMGLTGSGTEEDPYIFSGGLNEAQLEAWLKGLPNWAPDRLLQGDLTWIDPPTGEDLEKLATPEIVFGTPTGDAVIVSWNSITNGTTYTLQRDISNSFSNPTTVYSGGDLTHFDVGLTPLTQYWYRLRVTAIGFAGSNYAIGNITTDVAGNVTPAAPTLTANDNTNTLSASHVLGASEIVFSTNDGVYVAYAGAISVGNVARAAGYWKFKIKSAPGRNESPVASSPAFTVADDGSTPITAPVEVENQTWDAETHSIISNDGVIGGTYRSKFNEHFLPSSVGYVQALVETGTQLELGLNATQFEGNPFITAYKSYPQNKVEVKIGSTYLTLSNEETGPTYLRLTAQSTTQWLFQFSRDGSVWQGDQTIARTAGQTLYLRVRDNMDYTTDPGIPRHAIRDMKGSGLSI